MKFTRSLLFLILVTPITALAGLLVSLAYCLPMAWRFQIAAVWRAIFLAICRYVLGIHYRVIGAENMPRTPSVILAKHQSAWETIALQSVFPPLVFVLKRSLVWIPFLGWAFAAMKMILIDRGASRKALKQVFTQGTERLQAGYWVLIFPEGTRTPTGQQGQYKSGGVYLASKAGVPMVPVAHNAGEFWPKNAFIKKPGMITVSIGPAIYPEGKTAEELTREVETWIEAEMRRIAPHFYA